MIQKVKHLAYSKQLAYLKVLNYLLAKCYNYTEPITGQRMYNSIFTSWINSPGAFTQWFVDILDLSFGAQHESKLQYYTLIIMVICKVYSYLLTKFYHQSFRGILLTRNL
jgi:hypothetical protein